VVDPRLPIERIQLRVQNRRAHIVLLGGQDTPSLQSLRERWKRSMSGVLPCHDLTVVEWPNPFIGRSKGKLERVEVASTLPLTAAGRSAAQQGLLDRIAARAVREVIAGLDKHVRFDSQGRAQSVLGHAIYSFTQFSVDALYDRGGLGQALLELAEQALCESHVDLVVAHSFGGTVALRAAWALQERGTKLAPFGLLTLGTASGYTVERAPMFAAYRNARGIERSQQISSWQHFYSKSDAVVGGGQMPRAFLDIEIVKVHTGPFLRRDRAHGLSRYLATPAVRSAIGDAVCAGFAASEVRAGRLQPLAATSAHLPAGPS
jgi:hypothetical protein